MASKTANWEKISHVKLLLHSPLEKRPIILFKKKMSVTSSVPDVQLECELTFCFQLFQLFYPNVGNHEALFLLVNVLDLFLKNETSDAQITFRNEVII